MDRDTQLSLEYDFYGGLLTKRQSEVMELYHEDNLSLSEIAAELGVSRQAVHDALKNAQSALDGYEEKLGLVRRFERERQGIAKIDAIIDSLTAEGGRHPAGEDRSGLQTPGDIPDGRDPGDGTPGEGANGERGGWKGDLRSGLYEIKTIIDSISE